MTRKFLPLLAVVGAFLSGVLLAHPANAVINADSRIVAVDVPKVAERASAAIIITVHSDGTRQAVKVHIREGVAMFLADEPATITAVRVRVGTKNHKPDAYVVTNMAPAVDAHGQIVGYPFPHHTGTTAMVRADGGIYSLDGVMLTPPVTL